MTILLLFSLGASLLLIALSIPMIMGRVKPNGWYGFRTPLTLDHPEIWYPVNRYAGKWLLGLGIVIFLAAIGLPLLLDIDLDDYAIWIAVITLVGLGVAFFMGWRYSHQLAGE
jgi:hypothetical protein